MNYHIFYARVCVCVCACADTRKYDDTCSIATYVLNVSHRAYLSVRRDTAARTVFRTRWRNCKLLRRVLSSLWMLRQCTKTRSSGTRPLCFTCTVRAAALPSRDLAGKG